ncbi:unnamed protein product [Calypogeia fissa]
MKDPAEVSDDIAKISRFHSLLFGTDVALANEDQETSLGLGLRLAGFLASEVKTPEDEVYIRKILLQVHDNIASACRATQSDRDVLELANCSTGFQFPKGRPTDRDRLTRSKYLSNVFPPTGTLQKEPEPSPARIGPTVQSEPSTSLRERAPAQNPSQTNSVERSESTSGRNLCQSKLTSLYTGSRTNPGEKFRPPAAASGLQHSNSKPSSSRSLPAGEPCSSPNSDDQLNRKRGPSLEFNRPAQKRLKPESEDENEYDYRRRSHSNGRPATRGNSDDDDDRRRRSQNSYFSKNPGKTKPEQDDISDGDVQELPTSFITARQQLAIQEAKKNKGNPSPALKSNPVNYGNKTLGMRPRGPRGAFIPPFRNSKVNGGTSRFEENSDNGVDESTRRCLEMLSGPDGELPDRLRNIEPKLLEHITNEIMERDPMVRWDDIAGLEHAKKCVTEMVIWPLLRPDIFQGCRAPAKGLLLFGPPGTGKTMIGKAIAGEARATFFSISASSVMSKWMGEAEKLVRALFGVAACRQPAVIFIDEVDSLLSQRKSEGENECSRKIKTQFLVEMEGCGTGSEQVLVIGATNRPQELDEAARRRLSKRLYIPLPSSAARSWIVRNLLGKDGLLSLSDEEIDAICTCTDGYSGSDMKNLVKEASMGPLREALMNGKHINDIKNDDMRPISLQDFMSALQQVRSSVSQDELGMYEDWNKQYGSLAV